MAAFSVRTPCTGRLGKTNHRASLAIVNSSRTTCRGSWYTRSGQLWISPCRWATIDFGSRSKRLSADRLVRRDVGGHAPRRFRNENDWCLSPTPLTVNPSATTRVLLRIVVRLCTAIVLQASCRTTCVFDQLPCCSGNRLLLSVNRGTSGGYPQQSSTFTRRSTK